MTAIFKRSSGILMHITSLPGAYGHGSFGAAARDFVDFLHETGSTYWQTLPFGPTDSCNSPYKSYSAFAGNPLFIDLDSLCHDGLLTVDELKKWQVESPWVVDYAFVNKTREDTLRLAFSRCSDTLKEKIRLFAREEQYWLPDYALYMTLKKIHTGDDWYLWEDAALRLHQPEAIKQAALDYAEEILYQEFLQYTFFTQWASLKDYANTQGVEIIGDMPIYVSLESADVWACPDAFDLDEDGHPKHVAGVPPDYFCEDGQLWGNPLYNWSAMKADGYTWWLQRLKHSLKVYDAVRIDHFRAFSAYWSVDAAAKTARVGKWLKGPGMDFFDVVFKTFDNPKIIAEDLGVIDEGVLGLLADTGLPGMRVLQFAFIEESNNCHLPHNYTQNTIVYTGTHDNNTLLGWLWELEPHQRDYAFEYTNFNCTDLSWQNGGSESASCRNFIRCLWQSCANVAIVPIQDICGFGSDTKMNKPGSADGNWTFRLAQEAFETIDRKWLKNLNHLYKRHA